MFTLSAISSICLRTRLLQSGWNKTGKLHGSLKVTRCDSRGWKSIDMTLNMRICCCAICDPSSRCRRFAAGTMRQVSVRIPGYIGVSSQLVQIRNVPRYFRRSKSAMIQSTMCGSGVRKYTASVSFWSGRRSSMRSMSVVTSQSEAPRESFGSNGRRALVIFWLRMSSSLTTLVMSFWLFSSTTRTFHCAGR
jgi:hypothetical protein